MPKDSHKFSLTTTLPIGLRRLVEKRADQHGVSMCQVMCWALADYFKKPELGEIRPYRIGRPRRKA